MRLTADAKKLKITVALISILVLIYLLSWPDSFPEFDVRPSSVDFLPPPLDSGLSEPQILTMATFPITDELLEFVVESEERFGIYRAKRDASIAVRGFKKIDPWTNPIFWDYFATSISCPYPLSRVGALGDGGKWICGLGQISKKSESSSCIVYSFGVGGDSSFEDEILSSTNCSVFAFDPTVGGMNLNLSKYPGRVQFFKVGLGAVNSNLPAKSLNEHMTQLGHDWIDLVKMDIEGPEFPVLDQVVQDFPDGLPFAHLNIELHLNNFKEKNKTEIAELEAKQFHGFWTWWAKLEIMGLRAFKHEVNHLYNIISRDPNPRLVEYSFLNIKPFLDRLNYTYTYKVKNIHW